MEKTFDIVPASSGAFTFIWILCVLIGVIMIGVIGVMASFGYQARHATFTVNEQGLRISPGIYSRFIPRERIVAEGVKVLDLNKDTAYAPRWRINGAGLFGYDAGWFKLQNKEKALLFVTDRSSVVYVPTTENYSVLLSVKDAAAFSGSLRNWD